MFEPRALKLSMVKIPKKNKATPEVDACPTIVPDEIHQIVKDQVRHTAIAVVAVVAACTILHTASEIAINITPKKH